MSGPSQSETENHLAMKGNIILVTDGSYGDVLPFLAIASHLSKKQYGERNVFLLCSEHFEQLVQTTNPNIHFVSTCSKSFYSERWGASADTNRKINDASAMITGAKSLVERQRDIYKLMYGIIAGNLPKDNSNNPTKTVILAHPLVSAANIFCEKYAESLNVSMITILLSPIYLRSFEHDYYPAYIMKAYYYFVDIMLDSVLAGPINNLRNEMNGKSSKISRICHNWLLSDSCIIALFPKWFVRSEPIPKLSNVTKFMGFITPEKNVVSNGTNSNSDFPDSLKHFMEEGKKKELKIIVFTPGSLNPPNATKFFMVGKAAVEKLNADRERVAAIFLTKYKNVLPKDVSAERHKNIVHFTFISLSDLLESCHLCVHHGGTDNLHSAEM